MVAVALDEHLGDPRLVDALAEFGIEAVRVVDVLGQGTPDPALLQWSGLAGLVLVTADVRIQEHIYRDGHRHHAGVIIFDTDALHLRARDMAPFIAAVLPVFVHRDQVVTITLDERGDIVHEWGI